MTTPPLPASPCVRARLIYDLTTTGEGGNRLYFSYAGAAPTGANCTTLATDIASAWSAHIAALVQEDYILNEVDVLDIATDSGLSGQWTGADPGTDTNPFIVDSVATNIEFDIARRYRGGKPRIFLPPPGTASLLDKGHWTPAFIAAANTAFAAFIAEIEALSIGAMGTLQHVNLSYYKGFTNVTNSSGRTRAAPTYRPTALIDPVTGYSTKAVIGSQKRRRTATTP